MDTGRRELRGFGRDGQVATGNELTARCGRHAFDVVGIHQQRAALPGAHFQLRAGGHFLARVAELFARMWSNDDDYDRATADRILEDRYTWLEEGVVDPSIDGPWIAEPAPGPSVLPNLRRGV